jgi:hypothetical protein
MKIWSYMNPYMLFGRHLGFRGNFEKALAERDPRALELHRQMEKIKQEALTFMKVSAVWQFFEAEREGKFNRACSRRAEFRLCTRSIPAPARGRQALPERLHPEPAIASENGQTGSHGAFRGHRRRRYSRKIREMKAFGTISLFTWIAGARDRIRRGLRRMGASPHSRRLGIPRSAHA